jgi:alkylation response protein AidB-like acyl-CoA dehydrogenase
VTVASNLTTRPADVLAAVARLAEEEIASAAAAIDRERRFPSEAVTALGEAGALGLFVPSAHGGSQAGLAELAAACETIGRACASTGMVFLMHSVTAATLGAGGGERAAEALSALASGHALGTLAFSERGTGAHFYSPDIQVTRDLSGSQRASGRKSFVTSGGHADYYALLLAGESEGTADMFIVPASQPGLRADGTWQGLGMAGNSSVALDLDDLELEQAALVGGAGKGLDLVFSAVAPFFLVGLAAVSTGIASAALDAATEHVKQRVYADGNALSEVQYVQHLIADMDLTVRTTRLLVENAAALGDAGDASALVAIMEAKIAATEAAVRVTELALLATGGQGYTPALPIERHLRDARAGAVMAPTNAVLRNWVGKAVLGLPVP